MTIHVKNGGVWRDSQPSVRNAGVWKDVQEGYVNNAGVWQKFYQRGLTWIVYPDHFVGGGWNTDFYDGYRRNSYYGSAVPPVEQPQGGGYRLFTCRLFHEIEVGGSTTVSCGATLEFGAPTGGDMTGMTVLVDGQPIVMTSPLSYVWGSGSPSPPNPWQYYPFLICGYNRTYDPRTYSKTYSPFTVQLLI